MRAFRNLIERQIAKARAHGQLSGLEGEGKPLPERPVETGEQAAMSAGYRMMAEAGVLPEEFRLKKELDAARRMVVSVQEGPARDAAMARVADLELRYNIAREARQSFMS